MTARGGAARTHDSISTIAAIATAPGRGAIAIVRVSGPLARDIGARVFRARAPLRARRATRGTVVDEHGERIDEGLALLFPAPQSYTGEDVLELHVHGSPAIAREVLLALLAAGARLAGPGEFTRRAFYAGKLDLTEAEAVADLIEAEHRGAARAAAARLSGGLASAVERLEADLASVLEELSAALDFPDEVEAPAADALAARIDAVDRVLGELALSWERGRIVREGLGVAIVGPPNAGKSSLLNALLGADRALVSAVAGTTRDTIEESLALGGGSVARVIDTAGLRRGRDELEAAGIARSERALADASVVLVVVDGSVPLGPEAHDILARTRDRDRVVYFNKRDLGAAGYDQRGEPERTALFGSVREASDVALVRAALEGCAHAERIDVARPHLGTARQADKVLEARRALAFARQTLASAAPVDLIAPDLATARTALGELTGRDASEALLDAIFARFCIGK
jgi:tRNA modification GTPase